MNETRRTLVQIVGETPKCRDELLVDGFLDFLEHVCPILARPHPRYNVQHFKEALKDTNLDGNVMYGFSSAIARICEIIKGKDLRKNDIRKYATGLALVVASYIENPNDEILEKVGNFIFAAYAMTTGNGKPIKRRAEAYKEGILVC